MTEVITFPGVATRPSKAQRESARTRFPRVRWPRTGLPPGRNAVKRGNG